MCYRMCYRMGSCRSSEWSGLYPVSQGYTRLRHLCFKLRMDASPGEPLSFCKGVFLAICECVCASSFARVYVLRRLQVCVPHLLQVCARHYLQVCVHHHLVDLSVLLHVSVPYDLAVMSIVCGCTPSGHDNLLHSSPWAIKVFIQPRTLKHNQTEFE